MRGPAARLAVPGAQGFEDAELRAQGREEGGARAPRGPGGGRRLARAEGARPGPPGCRAGRWLTMEEDAKAPGRRGRGAGMLRAPRRRRTRGRALPLGSLSGALGASTGKWRPLCGSPCRSQLLNLRGKITIIMLAISKRGKSKSRKGCIRYRGLESALPSRLPERHPGAPHPSPASLLIAPQNVLLRLSSWGRPQLLPSLFLSTMTKGASNPHKRQWRLLLQELSVAHCA